MTEIDWYAEHAIRTATAILYGDWMAREGKALAESWNMETAERMAWLFAEHTLQEFSAQEREQHFVDAFRVSQANTRALAVFDSLKTDHPEAFSQAFITAWEKLRVELEQASGVPLT